MPNNHFKPKAGNPKANHPTQPMKKEDVPQSNDEHIDEDFPGFPHAPAKESIINPKNKTEKATAGLKTKH